MKRAFPILSVITAVLLAYALYQALVVAPTDALQGDVYRIIYYHVPSAWTAFLLFFINFVASIQYLASAKESTQKAAKWVVIVIGAVGVIACFLPQVQHLLPTGMRPSAVATTVLAIPAFYFFVGKYFPGQKLDVLAVTSAEVGVVFCTIVLVTGPIWARPIWGVWWTWDPRLTMTVILWVIYASYLVLRAFGGDDDAVRRWAAVLAIVGVLDIPIIRVSVQLLPGIHPAVLSRREGGSGLTDPSMRLALYVSALAVLLLMAWLIALRVRMQRLADEIGELRRAALAERGEVA